MNSFQYVVFSFHSLPWVPITFRFNYKCLGNSRSTQYGQELILQFPTISQDYNLIPSFRHSTPFGISSPSLAHYLFNFNSFTIPSKHKAIPTFSMVCPLIFPLYELRSFIIHIIHMTITDCWCCLLDCHLILNVSMHVSLSYLDSEISEAKNTGNTTALLVCL